MTLEQVAGGFGIGGPKVVLVVSDDASAMAVQTEAIKRAGHIVRRVETARGARDLVLGHAVNLAVVDARLPDEEGVILGQSLWLDHGIPFIQLTAFDDTESVRRAIANGATLCMLKPVGVEQLKVAIEVALVQGREFARLRRSVERLSEDFERRNVVSVAIGMSMERFGVDETEAFEMMLFAARARQQKLPEFCQQLIDNQGEAGLRRTLGTFQKQGN